MSGQGRLVSNWCPDGKLHRAERATESVSDGHISFPWPLCLALSIPSESHLGAEVLIELIHTHTHTQTHTHTHTCSTAQTYRHTHTHTHGHDQMHSNIHTRSS